MRKAGNAAPPGALSPRMTENTPLSAVQSMLCAPQLRLIGAVDEAMYAEFRNQLAAAPTDGALTLQLMTLGGNPEIARAMGDDLRLICEAGRTIYFLGKSAVYSAGATFMAAFPVENRYLTKGTRLMVHERQMQKTIQLAGPLRSCIDQLRATLHEIETSIAIEEEGFAQFVAGSAVSVDEVRGKAGDNWYITCEEALDRGLIAGVV